MGGSTDRTALIIGGGGGLGRAMARALAQEGLAVACADLLAEGAEETASQIAADGGRALPLEMDAADRGSVKDGFGRVAAELGGPDVLINSGMWIRYAPISSIDEETVDRMLAIGLKAVIWAIQEAEPVMAARGGGSIINMCSPVAEIGLAYSAVYAAVKGGIAALTRQAAVELGPKGIRVNAISPGPIRTPGTLAVVDEAGWKARAAKTPLGHLGEPYDVANLAVFLASERSRMVTGVTIRVDGGLTINAA